jgi:nicotinate dehydrogenase subunit B
MRAPQDLALALSAVVAKMSSGADHRSIRTAPKIVRDGNFLAVIARGEYQAIKAMRLLAAAARWEEKPSLPALSDLPNTIISLSSEDSEIFKQGQAGGGDERKLEARFTRPYQSHGSIGPSCAVAQASGDHVTVWTHTQGVFPDRDAIAEMLRLPGDRCGR